MSREIKFRAWDNECKVIREYDELKGLTLDALDASGFELEQYTGLKDVNGKNIYEGDVVRVSDVDGNGNYVDTVIWGGEDDYPAFDLKNHAVEYDSNALSSIVNAGFEIMGIIKLIGSRCECHPVAHSLWTLFRAQRFAKWHIILFTFLNPISNIVWNHW